MIDICTAGDDKQTPPVTDMRGRLQILCWLVFIGCVFHHLLATLSPGLFNRQ